MSFLTCLLVAAGGAIGTVARYLISVLAQPASRQLPLGTVAINASGSFLIGLFGTLTLANGRYPMGENARLFVMIGLCGGYTTFSSFSLQTLDLLRSGAVVRAAINVAGSVTLCVLAVSLGHLLATHLNKGGVRTAQAVLEEKA